MENRDFYLFMDIYIFYFPYHDSGKKIQLNKITCSLLEVLAKVKLLQSVYKMYSIFKVLLKKSS